MKNSLIISFLSVVTLVAVIAMAGPPSEDGDWSKAVRGLEARITLVQKPPFNRARILMPFLELRNVGDLPTPLKVRCDRSYVKFELVDASGNRVKVRTASVRSGPHAHPGTISLPYDSEIRINMHCTNWGVPRDATAMIATDSGAWILREEDKSKVFLRATIQGKKTESRHVWYGLLQTPLLRNRLEVMKSRGAHCTTSHRPYSRDSIALS